MFYKNKHLCDFCFEPVIPGVECPNCGISRENYRKPEGFLAPGANLNGRYIIGRAISESNVCATYYAFSAVNEKGVVLKEYFPAEIAKRAADGENIAPFGDKRYVFETGAQKFAERASAFSRLGANENIASVYDVFRANGTVYYAMEYLEGENLKDYIAQKGGKLDEDEVIYIARAICNGLIALNVANSIHGEITPENILVLRNGNIKLLDFGAAQKSVSATLKRGFVPPEQYSDNGREAAWTDVYALGAVMFYALSGKEPECAIDRIKRPELVLDGYVQCSVKLASIIKKCMEMKPESRYKDAAALATALDDISGGNLPFLAPAAAIKAAQAAAAHVATPVAPIQSAPDYQVNVQQAAPAMSKAKKATARHAAKKRKSNSGLIIALSIVAVLLILGIGIGVAWNYFAGSDTDAGGGGGSGGTNQDLLGDWKFPCQVCGSEAHQVHPECPVCGSMEHAEHPKPACETCGSLAHTTEEHEDTPVERCRICDSAEHKDIAHPCEICGGTGHPKEDHKCIICKSKDHVTADHVCSVCKGKGHREGAHKCTKCNELTHTTENHPEPKTDKPKAQTKKPESKKPKCSVCGSTAHTTHPKAETPKTETPKAEAPKAETPKTETPKAETPKPEAPKPTCSVCGSTAHTEHPKPKCPDCGSEEHTTHPKPKCPDCGSEEHTTHPKPKCSVCGSTEHTDHDASLTEADISFD